MVTTTATPLYTVGDLAKRYGRDDQTVRRWARKGVHPSIKPEGVYLFTEEHVQAFLTGTVPPPPKPEPRPTRNPRKYATSK